MHTQIKLRKAFKAGMTGEYGAVVAEIADNVVGFSPSAGLGQDALLKMRNTNSSTIQAAISSNSVDGGTLLDIRSNALISALLGDIQEVKQWGRIGLELCQGVNGGGWNETEPEWGWMLENPERYCDFCIQIKQFVR